MAARKSCTHLTWAQAKANSGVGGSSGASGFKKNKNVARKQDHNQVLAQKIIAKNSASQTEINQHRAAERRARKEEKRAEELAQKRKEEKERQRLEQVVKPCEQAQERMALLAARIQQQEEQHTTDSTTKTADTDDLEEMKKIVECREMQLDELMALEAIFVDTETCRASAASKVEELREKIDAVHDQGDDLNSLRAVVQHPPLSFTLELNVDDDDDRIPDSLSSDMELTAAILLKVTLPPFYPLYCEDESNTRLPEFELVDVMVTDRTAVCSPDKALESLAFLENPNQLNESMMEQIREILPDLCIYEVAVTWLSENVFDYMTLRTHASISAS